MVSVYLVLYSLYCIADFSSGNGLYFIELQKYPSRNSGLSQHILEKDGAELIRGSLFVDWPSCFILIW